MLQSSILHHINDAKQSHLHWLKHIENLTSGLPVDQTLIIKDENLCNLGKWINFEGLKIRSLDGISNILNTLEHYHKQLHDEYLYIHKLYFITPKQRSMLYKFFTFNSQRITQSEKEQAKEHLRNIKNISEEVLILLNILEERIKNISIMEIDKIA